MKHMLTLVDGEYSQATVYFDGELYAAVAGHHPNFDLIVERLLADGNDESVVTLFDVETTIKNEFKRLTSRVTVRNGEVFLDGDKQDGPIVKQILRFIDEGHTNDLEAVVNFMEKVETNTDENCRKQLFRWLETNEFTIAQDGDVVAYKGCALHNGVLSSTREAPASENVTVNDEQIVGYVPQTPGAIVEMPRSVVDHDPTRTCSVGLHVANFRYANSFGGGGVVEVRVNPRDFVSVTVDSNSEKIRCCRYRVVGEVKESYKTPVLSKEQDKVYRDTRDNHKNQTRYPKGHDRAGQFKPKSA